MAEGKEAKKKGISRRDFIKGTGLAVGGVAISSTVLGVACSPTTNTPVSPLTPVTPVTPVTPPNNGQPVTPVTPPNNGQPATPVTPVTPVTPAPGQVVQVDRKSVV